MEVHGARGPGGCRQRCVLHTPAQAAHSRTPGDPSQVDCTCWGGAPLLTTAAVELGLWAAPSAAGPADQSICTTRQVQEVWADVNQASAL